jgi:hypothetical protein
VSRKEFLEASLFFAEVIDPVQEQLYQRESIISFDIGKKECLFRNLLECVQLECSIEKSSLNVFCSDTRNMMFNWVCIEGIENLFTLLTHIESFPKNLKISDAEAQFRMYDLCSFGDDIDFRHDLYRLCAVRRLHDNYGGDLFSNVVIWFTELTKKDILCVIRTGSCAFVCSHCVHQSPIISNDTASGDNLDLELQYFIREGQRLRQKHYFVHDEVPINSNESSYSSEDLRDDDLK